MEHRDVVDRALSVDSSRSTMSDSFKSRLQSAQYRFPYHHIPHFLSDGRPSVVRGLSWGLEYLCYTQAAAAIAVKVQPASVLDVGCGDGAFLSVLNSAGLQNLSGIDVVEEAIRLAHALVPHAQFEKLDINEVTGLFELVTAIEVLEHISDELLTSFVRALQDRVIPGGHLLVCVPTTVRRLNPKHFRHFDLSLLSKIISAAAPELVLKETLHVFASSRLISALSRACFNRFWTLEVHAIQSLAWKYIQRVLATAPAGKACHLIALYQRQASV
jgi:2-polyprenyl-3-methyl-5-hydroxy-6-metoxy-1,4-benzoquinol methylase